MTDRFTTLEESMNRLQGKVGQERYMHRKLIDELIEKQTAYVCDCTVMPENPPVDLLSIDHGTYLKF